MYVNTDAPVLSVNEIEALVNQASPDATLVMKECKKALLWQQASSATESAKLLFWYAEAMGANQLHALQAAPYAQRAAHLANEASDSNFALVVQARSLYISLVATTLTQEQFQLHVRNLRHSVNMNVNMLTPRLSDEQKAQIQQCLNRLNHLGRNLTQSSAFTAM